MKFMMAVILFFGLLGLSFLMTSMLGLDETEEDLDKCIYSGPIPEGYDEDFFRRTGITKSAEIDHD